MANGDIISLSGEEDDNTKREGETMDVQEITFGVEIETVIPRGLLSVGPHGCGNDIPQLPGWKADADPSIRVTDYSDSQACEFVSPVYKGAAGLRQLLADLDVIRGFGAKINDSCGLHIHVGIDKQDAALVARLTTLVANFEKAIYASTGTKKRETGRWCNGLSQYGTVGAAQSANRCSRYHVANFATNKPTVEFRAFGATLNATKLVGYVRLCVGLVERALRAKHLTNWSAKQPVETSPIRRGGEGQTAIARLFYQLGWTKGRTDHTHGDLSGEGLPGVDVVKTEFVRLAKKYDAPPVVPPVVRTPRTDGTTASATRFPIGTRVRIETGSPIAPGQGAEGVVIQRVPRRSPVVRFDDGRTRRVRLNRLRAV